MLKEELAAKKRFAQATADGWEILGRLICEANLSKEDETRLAIVLNCEHPLVTQKLLNEESKTLASTD